MKKIFIFLGICCLVLAAAFGGYQWKASQQNNEPTCSNEPYKICDEKGNVYLNECSAEKAGLSRAEYGATYCPEYLEKLEPTTTEKPIQTTPRETCMTQVLVGNGYSFCLPANHTFEKLVRQDLSTMFTLVSRETGDTITVDQSVNTGTYLDSDSKFGDVKVTYNAQKKIWEATGECDSPAPCNRSFVTSQGVQVFIGRSRWLTYIAPLSTNSVLVLNSTGGGYTKPLEDLIQTVIIEKK